MDRLYLLYNWANPEPQDRLPLHLSNLPILALPFPLLLLQVHLLLRYPLNRLNHVLRILLIFPSILLAFRAGFGHRFKLDDDKGGSLQCYNVALGIYAAFAVAKSLEWGLMTTRPRLRNQQAIRKKRENGHAVSEGHSTANGQASSTSYMPKLSEGSSKLRSKPNAKGGISSPISKPDSAVSAEQLPLFFPGSFVPLEVDYLASMRGLGWEFGIKSPAGSGRIWTPREKRSFLLKRMGNAVACIILMDLLDNIMKHPRVNPASRFGGGSLWESQQGVLGRIGPQALTMLLGFIVYAAIQGCFSVLSIFFVLLGSSPDYWTPLQFSRPWEATSLRNLWVQHWHSLFRRSFLFLAYFPTRNLTKSKVMAVLSTFVLSGILHETGQWSMIRSPPFDQDRMWGRSLLFFLLQGIGTVAEEAWEVKTGFKVQGVGGWIWTYGWMTLTGLLPSNVWFKLGMANSHASLRFTRPLVDGLVELAESWTT